MHNRRWKEKIMPEDFAREDVAIIQAAYAEQVSVAFRIFAENLSTGQSEADCAMRFRRALELIRKTRDLALKAASGHGPAEPAAQQSTMAAEESEPLSAEDQALIDQALSGTTGHH